MVSCWEAKETWENENMCEKLNKKVKIEDYQQYLVSQK